MSQQQQINHSITDFKAEMKDKIKDFNDMLEQEYSIKIDNLKLITSFTNNEYIFNLKTTNK